MEFAILATMVQNIFSSKLQKIRGDYVMIAAVETDKAVSDHYKEASKFVWKSIGRNGEII